MRAWASLLTKQSILLHGNCKYGDHCAMDSAVRYSMITLGMEAEPTASELINRHTTLHNEVEAVNYY